MSNSEPCAGLEWLNALFPMVDRMKSDDMRPLRDGPLSAIQNPPTEIRKLKDWIERVCLLANVKPSKLANVASISPSTVNRFLKDTNKSASLNAKTITALENAGKKLLQESGRLAESEFINRVIEVNIENDEFLLAEFSNNRRKVMVCGSLPLNHKWQLDTFRSFMGLEYEIVIPISAEFAKSLLIGFEISNARNEDEISYNEIVICTPTWLDNFDLKGSERVIIAQKCEKDSVSVGIRDLNKDLRDNYWLMPIEAETEIVEPSFLGRGAPALVKGELGVAFVVLGSYRTLV